MMFRFMPSTAMFLMVKPCVGARLFRFSLVMDLRMVVLPAVSPSRKERKEMRLNRTCVVESENQDVRVLRLFGHRLQVVDEALSEL